MITELNLEHVNDWTWEDLNKKIVKVGYSPYSPEILEPEYLAFLDIENGKIYDYRNFRKSDDN